MEELEKTPEAMAALAAIMDKEHLAHGILVTRDFKHTVIVARTLYQKGTVDHHVQLISELKAFLETEQFAQQGFDLHIFGRALISERFFSLSAHDQGLWGSITYVLILLTLFITFRSVHGVLLPMMVVAFAILMALGFQGFWGWPFNLLNTALPLVILVIGIGDAVHILMGFYQFRNRGQSPRQAAKMAVQSRWVACFYTSLTTIVGFLAIALTKLAPLREYALVAAMGCALAFLLSVTTLPAVLSLINLRPSKAKRLIETGWVAQLTRRLPTFTLQNRKWLGGVGVGVALASLIMSLHLSTDANFVTLFKSNTPIRKDFTYFDKTYGGGQNLEFVLNAGRTGGIKEPEFLRQALKFQGYLESLADTGQANSVLNYIRKMNQAIHDDDPVYYTIPETRNLVAQYLLLYENANPDEDLSDLKSTDEQHMRISIRVHNMPTGRMTQLVNTIETELTRHYPSLPVVITGDLVLFNKMDFYIADGLVKSFSVAAVVILLCFMVIFRSVKYGILALTPSLVPILCGGAVMYLLRIPLDIGSVIIATVTLGIAVDDTVHLMTRYLRARRDGQSVREGIDVAMAETGRAVTFTSFILVCGFGIMVFGSIMTSVYFGLFAVIIILLALIGDLVFLPALLFIVDARAKARVKDALPSPLPQQGPMGPPLPKG
jgi:hypothetical protein